MGVLRLLIFGTRGTWTRLAAISGGVAVGVTLALLLVAGSTALETRDARAAWTHPILRMLDDVQADGMLAAPSRDTFDGERITRLDVAVPAGASSALPGGLLAPGPGAYLASPALERLIASTPADELGDRYGEAAGTLPPELLRSADSLVVVVGATPGAVSTQASAGIVESFDARAFGGQENYQTLAVVGALALLVPAFLLVSVATRLGAASRAERWQTLLTIGASRTVIRRVAILEATGTALLGSVIGLGLFLAARPLLGLLPVAGERLMPADLTVSAPVVLTVISAIVLGSILSAARTARRADTSPVSRAVFERRPSLWRLAPLVIGILAFVLLERFASLLPIPQVIPVVLCFGLVAVGLLVAGPVLTWAAGSVFQRLSTTASGVVGSRRIVRTPRAVFRSVAGLVAATFVITVFAFATSAQVTAAQFTTEPLLPPGAVAVTASAGSELDPADVAAALDGRPGITGIYTTRTDADFSGVYVSGDEVRALGHPDFAGAVAGLVGGVFSLGADGPPVTDADVPSLEGMRVSDVIVTTDGSETAIEQARTAVLALAGVDRSQTGALTRTEAVSGGDSDLATQFAEIGRLAIVIVTALAAAVLTISTIAALYDRKRTFALLQLMGMPRTTLRKVITWETAVPLLGIIIPTILLGWATAWLLITSLSERTIGRPDALLWVSLTATAIMAVLSILIASGVGTAITRSSENTRHE